MRSPPPVPLSSTRAAHPDPCRHAPTRRLDLTKAVRKNPQRYWHLPADPTSVPADFDTGDAYAQRGECTGVSVQEESERESE